MFQVIFNCTHNPFHVWICCVFVYTDAFLCYFRFQLCYIIKLLIFIFISRASLKTIYFSENSFALSWCFSLHPMKQLIHFFPIQKFDDSAAFRLKRWIVYNLKISFEVENNFLNKIIFDRWRVKFPLIEWFLYSFVWQWSIFI